MRLVQITHFLAIVESGSIRAAARTLGVAQPTVTVNLRSLEDELQVQLVERGSRGITLTSAGRAFFARAKAADSELRKAVSEASEAGGSSAGWVAIGVGPAVAALILPEAITRFRQQYPSGRLRIVEGLAKLLLPAVRDETLDFVMGLRPAGALDSWVKFRPLYRTRLAIVARRGHPLRHSKRLSELASAHWLTTATLGEPGGAVERLFASAGLPPPEDAIRCESYNTVAAVIAGTDMLGVIQQSMLDGAFGRGLLQQLSITDPLPSLTAGIFARAGTPPTRLAAAMAKAATAAAQRLVRPPT
jgi:LysR family transcriptional regulator, regulator of abg operon